MTQINGTTFLLGSDPEVFVTDGNGDLVSAVGLVPGTKEEPFELDGGMVQVDGLALEFGIAPAANRREYIDGHRHVLAQVKSLLPADYSLLFVPTVTFSDEILAAQPPEALELGCDPDYNAYTLQTNPRPQLPRPGLRSAGGHVHIGYDSGLDTTDPDHLLTCAAIATALDWRLGVPSLGWDTNQERRSLYGNPGAFRPKSYGLEYRSLSNQWLVSDELIGLVYDQTIKGIEDCFAGADHLKVRSFYSGQVNLTAADIIRAGWNGIGRQHYQEALRVQ